MDQGGVTPPRRRLLTLAAAGAVLAAAGCAPGKPQSPIDMGPAEDLMREHGVLRRLTLIYREAAALVRANFSSVDGRPIWRAADLIRRFGEAYHEQLEETHVFPQAMKAGGAAVALVPILIAQHARGKQITAFIQSKTSAGAIAGADAGALVGALETFARMQEAHAAYEDTVVIPAWRASLSKQALADAGAQFDDIEKTMFKGDGVAQALAEVAAIETALRLQGLARYTAPAPGEAAAGILPAPETNEGAD